MMQLVVQSCKVHSVNLVNEIREVEKSVPKMFRAVAVGYVYKVLVKI